MARHCFVLLLLFLPLNLAAAPTRPANDATVLVVLPSATLPAPERRALSEAVTLWRAAPRDPGATDRLARVYLQLARTSADPRWVGYALATLQPWNGQDTIPPALRLVRAIARQAGHQFGEARRDLDRLLAQHPDYAEARLQRASLALVQGEPQLARADCLALLELATLLPGLVCQAEADAASGQASAALARLTALTRMPAAGLTPELHAWLLRTRADVAMRLGQWRLAEGDLRQLLQTDAATAATRAAWADWLLATRQWRDVVAFAARWPHDDGLLLRRALAEQQLAPGTATASIRALADRFASARLRGERLHLREEARFVLDLQNDPQSALTLALANWQIQREVEDARLVLRCALAARQPAAARPVLDWMQRTGFEDRELQQLARRAGVRS